MTKKRTDQMSLVPLNWGFGGPRAGGWRDQSSVPYTANDMGYYIDLAQDAEKACLDMIFFADLPAMSKAGTPATRAQSEAHASTLEPLTLVSALAMATSRIGLGATASTSFYEPYNIARLFMSIDHISGGRVGWNIVTSDQDEAAMNFGLPQLPDHAARYRRANEFVDVVLELWNSWEPGALKMDRAAGIAYDPAKVHEINHDGEFFKVAGPLNVSRSAQGHPVLIQAGSSEAGRELIARVAEVNFAANPDIPGAQAFYADVKGRMAKYGRGPDELKILQAAKIHVGETEELARKSLQQTLDTMTPEMGLRGLTEFLPLGTDLSDLDYDAPVPQDRIPKASNASTSLFQNAVNLMHQGKTLREVVYEHTTGEGNGEGIVGDPVQVADFLEEKFMAEACDGFMIYFMALPSAQKEFTRLVVPELQRRGLFRTEYPGTTFRETLGLAVPR